MDADPLTALYRRMLEGWNAHNADAFAADFADDGVVVGFDGSQYAGRDEIVKQVGAIFADRQTGRYVGRVRGVRPMGDNAAVLRAVAGVVPVGATDINPSLNSIQSLTAERHDGRWLIVLYHNTPAAFHGQPELAEALTKELRAFVTA